MTSSSSASGTPTVVLVHGAFADASGWAGVVERLMAAGIPVRAIVNPLRGISADSAYVAIFRLVAVKMEPDYFAFTFATVDP